MTRIAGGAGPTSTETIHKKGIGRAMRRFPAGFGVTILLVASIFTGAMLGRISPTTGEVLGG
ncbi:hypothetical protein NKH89_12695 [Mesorhizobium sp. M0923]|uniref:hypothetical protein n=1 Tax=unclassified Mesorhizobium TaxID=325217 RepID=UPI0003D05A25|nr:hypothetical protein [Mesorhizobium sp. L48C026A00]ESZ08521.1 hypothetical protein X737_33750 [Mesorhizobium sp. L48C026A00]